MTTHAPHSRPGDRQSKIASRALTVITIVVLALLGAAVGVASTFAAGWLSRYWDAGQPAPAISVTALLAFLALLYTACRLLGWGSRRQSGAVAFAVGYVGVLIAALGYLPGGDVLITRHVIHYAFLFGSMFALALAVVRSGLQPDGTS